MLGSSWKAGHKNKAVTPSARRFKRCWHEGWPGQFHHTQVVSSITDRTESCTAVHPEQFLSDVLCSGGRRGVFICSLLLSCLCFQKPLWKNKLLWRKIAFSKGAGGSCCLTSENSSFSSSGSPNNLPELRRHGCSTSFLIIQQHIAQTPEKWCDRVFLVTLARELASEDSYLSKACSCIYLTSHNHTTSPWYPPEEAK